MLNGFCGNCLSLEEALYDKMKKTGNVRAKITFNGIVTKYKERRDQLAQM